VLTYPGLASVRIDAGRSVRVRLERDDPHALDLLLTGPVMGVILHQRGALVLHGSGASHAGRACVFLGRSGSGKSTTAARLYRDGFTSVADDVVPLHIYQGRLLVTPGYPLHKLWPDAAVSLGLDPATMPPIGLEREKVGMPAPRDFRSEPIPLARVYVLTPGTTTRIEPMGGRAAFMEIVRHAYLANHLRGADVLAAHLARITRLLDDVPLRRLTLGPHASTPLAPLIEADLDEPT